MLMTIIEIAKRGKTLMEAFIYILMVHQDASLDF